MQRVTCFAVALTTAAATAIVWRSDKESSDFQIASSTYPNVFGYNNFPDELEEGEINCAATLIGDKFAITAAHCFAPEFTPFSVTIDGVDHDVVAQYANPCYNFNT